MNVSEELIREIVQKVLAEAKQQESGEDFVKEKDPSGIIKIATETVKCERFEQDGVALKDVVTLEEAPRMGCGIMELDHTSFEWTLTYDEYDLVLEGTLEIEIDGLGESLGFYGKSQLWVYTDVPRQCRKNGRNKSGLS